MFTELPWLTRTINEMRRTLVPLFGNNSAIIIPMSSVVDPKLQRDDQEPKEVSIVVRIDGQNLLLASATLIYLPAEDRTIFDFHGFLSVGKDHLWFFWPTLE